MSKTRPLYRLYEQRLEAGLPPEQLPGHVGVLVDGNRRWAREAGFDDVTPGSSTWCYATPDDRRWWGGLWADRILESTMARQVVDSGLATRADLHRIGQGWQRWAAAEDGWFSLLHGEILCRAR